MAWDIGAAQQGGWDIGAAQAEEAGAPPGTTARRIFVISSWLLALLSAGAYLAPLLRDS